MKTKRLVRASSFYLSIFVISLLVTGLAAQETSSVSTNLALTPPMGWNSWNKFACNVSEDLIKGMADAVVKSGMKDAGYVYVNIDDCWQVSRDASGNIVVDPQRFPHGMKPVGDYIHSLGLKFGVYSDAGSKTCAKRPGGLGHEYQDAIQYAAWGVDYLKYDWCSTTTQDAKASYANIRAALDAAGRPIVLSICEWGTAKPWLWGKEVGGNLWRSTGDINDRWGGQEKWPDGNGGRAVVLLNRGGTEQPISVSWEDLGYPNSLSASVRDLWQHKDLGKFTGKFSAAVASHGVVMIAVKP